MVVLSFITRNPQKPDNSFSTASKGSAEDAITEAPGDSAADRGARAAVCNAAESAAHDTIADGAVKRTANRFGASPFQGVIAVECAADAIAR